MIKIQKVSRLFIQLFNLLIFILPLVLLLRWLVIDSDLFKNYSQEYIITPEGIIKLSNVKWSLTTKFIGFLAEILNVLPVYLSLFILKSIFSNYKNELIFVKENAIFYKYLGCLFFIYAIVSQPLYHLLMILAATISNPPGHRYISLNFGTPNLEALFCGALVLMISWVMLEANKIYDDQQYTV